MKDTTETKRPRIVALASVKGGAGKSVAAIFIARQLSESGRRVLLVDCDPQGSATSYFLPDADYEELTARCLAAVLTGTAELDSAIYPEVFPNLDILPAALTMTRLEVELIGNPSAVHDFSEALRGTAYDFVILDTSPSIGLLLRSALYACDCALVPVQPDPWGLAGLDLLTAEAAHIRKHPAPPTVIAFPANVTAADADRLRAWLPDDVQCTSVSIPRSASVRRAILRRAIPGRAVTDAIRALIAEVLK